MFCLPTWGSFCQSFFIAIMHSKHMHRVCPRCQVLWNVIAAITAFGCDCINTDLILTSCGPCCQHCDEAGNQSSNPEDLGNVCWEPERTGYLQMYQDTEPFPFLSTLGSSDSSYENTSPDICSSSNERLPSLCIFVVLLLDLVFGNGTLNGL